VPDSAENMIMGKTVRAFYPVITQPEYFSGTNIHDNWMIMVYSGVMDNEVQRSF
jgi:hypothetical protein